MITAITVHVDVMSEFPAQDGDDMTDMGDTDGDDWMNVSRSHCLSAHFHFQDYYNEIMNLYLSMHLYGNNDTCI